MSALVSAPVAIWQAITRPAALQHRSLMRLCALVLMLLLPRVTVQGQPSQMTALADQAVLESVNSAPSSLQTGNDAISSATTKEAPGSKEGSDAPPLDPPTYLVAGGVQIQRQHYRFIPASVGSYRQGQLWGLTLDGPRARAPPTRS